MENTSGLQTAFELSTDDEYGDKLLPLRHFVDPVHDYVSFEPRVASFIDTKQFQRLRYLKQLGTASFVYPSGSHNRFEHCLGVGYLARLLVEGLRSRQPKLNIDDRDVFCVQVAGLVHDLGHGPFSHVFDNQFIARIRPDRTWCHEEGSEMMFDALVTQNPHIDIRADEVLFIKDLIRGRPRLTLHHNPPEKAFLFQIVANMENGLDVDKLDYIARDAANCGVKCGVATSRLINSCRAIGDHIAYPYKDHYNVFQIYHTRYALHKQVYNHKTGRAIEYMVVDALIAADPVMHFSDKIDNPDEYLFLTDSILEEIERSKDDRLEKSREIIDRIRRRDLYRIVDFKVVPSIYKESWKSILTAENIVSKAAELDSVSEDGLGEGPIVSEDLIVDWALLHMGMKDRDPMQLVRFYSKYEPNKSFVARRDEGSNLLPVNWQELQIGLFARDPRKMHRIQRAYRAIFSTLPVEVSTEPSSPIVDPEALIEGPSTLLQPADFVDSSAMKGGPTAPVTPVKRTISLTTSPAGSQVSRHRREPSLTEENQFMTLPAPESTVKKRMMASDRNPTSPQAEGAPEPLRTRRRVD